MIKAKESLYLENKDKSIKAEKENSQPNNHNIDSFKSVVIEEKNMQTIIALQLAFKRFLAIREKRRLMEEKVINFFFSNPNKIFL